MIRDTVLLVTTSYDLAAEYVLRELRSRQCPVFRFNTDEFPSAVRAILQPPDRIILDDGSHTLRAAQIKSVWYRRHVQPNLPPELDTGMREFCDREARAFLTGLFASIPTNRWLSQPQNIALAERKPYQLMVASQLGLTIPDTIITNGQSAARGFAVSRSVVAKAVSSGYIRACGGNRAVFTSMVKADDLNDLEGLALAPVIFQELVPKVSDIRVTVIADEVFAAEIMSQTRSSSRIDWRATDDPLLEHRRYHLPESVATQCRELVARLGLVFGAIDLALTEGGRHYFFEINPNGEWLWIEDQLKFPLSRKIAEWLDC